MTFLCIELTIFLLVLKIKTNEPSLIELANTFVDREHRKSVFGFLQRKIFNTVLKICNLLAGR